MAVISNLFHLSEEIDKRDEIGYNRLGFSFKLYRFLRWDSNCKRLLKLIKKNVLLVKYIILFRWSYKLI